MLNRYAETLVSHAVSLRPDQDLFIRGPEFQRETGLVIGECALRAGARSVQYHFTNPGELVQLICHGTFEQISLYHEAMREYIADIDKRGAAYLFLMHDLTSPPWLKDAQEKNPENYAYFIEGASKINNYFNQYARYSRFPFCAAPVARLDWAQQVFPNDDSPLDRLWEAIYRFALVDRSNYHAVLKETRAEQKRRTDHLNALEIQELHITGDGNDLFLSIAPRARWLSVSLETKTHQSYSPNFPSYEIFSVPECSKTRGTLVASMPFRLFNLSLVKDVVLEFQEGRVVDFEASEGKEALGAWLETDAGASMLGEIGLVGDDSPIYDLGIYFDLPNFDENTASHLALGDGVSFAFDRADQLSDSDLSSLGCNVSTIHTDICFGSPEVSIVATKTNCCVPVPVACFVPPRMAENRPTRRPTLGAKS